MRDATAAVTSKDRLPYRKLIVVAAATSLATMTSKLAAENLCSATHSSQHWSSPWIPLRSRLHSLQVNRPLTTIADFAAHRWYTRSPSSLPQHSSSSAPHCCSWPLFQGSRLPLNSPTQGVKDARPAVLRKSSPVISTDWHISLSRDRMRSPMRSPSVSSRAGPVDGGRSA